MNLPIPTLPTDNLYKFMALSGLAILIISTVFPMMRISEIKLKLVELETQTEIIGIETQKLKEEVSEKAEQIEKWMLRLKDLEADRKRMIKLQIKTVELVGQRKLVEVLLEDLRSYLIFIMVGGALGGLLCSSGFGLWYGLVQRPSDLLLKTQLKCTLMQQEEIQKESGHGEAQKTDQ